jgi:hypothetical protein
MPSQLAQLPGKAEGWLSEEDRYLFDVQGFLVVRQILSPALVDACNQALDAHPEWFHERGEDARLDGRTLPGYHASAAKAWGSSPSPGLTGTHGRADISIDTGASPFKDLVALPRAVRYMVGIIGPQIVFSGAGGFLQTKGAEGLTLHNGGNPDGTEPDDAVDRRQRQFYSWTNSARPDLQMRAGESRIIYSLTPSNPGDGGFVAIPGSHKGNLPAPLALRRLQSVGASAAVVQPALLAGDAVVFSENCTHGTGPWKSDTPRRALSYSYNPAYLSGGMDAAGAGHEVVDEGWEEGGAKAALRMALAATGQWWSSVQPGIVGDRARGGPVKAAEADGKTITNGGVPGTRGYRDGGRPDIVALLEAATAQEEEEVAAAGGAKARL